MSKDEVIELLNKIMERLCDNGLDAEDEPIINDLDRLITALMKGDLVS
jgi:hypothetical protein